MKITLSRFLLVLFAFFLSFNTAFAGYFDEEDEETATAKPKPEGKPLYTMVNLWYERPTKILPLFHQGSMIPVGTKVYIGDTSKKAFYFKTEDGAEYRIYSWKYYKMPGEEMIKLFFDKKDPKAKGGVYQKFSKMERKQIDLGQLKKGMSRKAAVMAYGFPPTHANPSVKADTWNLWKNRWDKLIVTFDNGKISEIRD